MDEAIVQEMADRPTAYTRTDETKKTKEKINVMEKSIQYCFEAIQLRNHLSIFVEFKIKTELKLKGLLRENQKRVPLNKVAEVKNQEKKEKFMLKEKIINRRIKNHNKSE